MYIFDSALCTNVHRMRRRNILRIFFFVTYGMSAFKTASTQVSKVTFPIYGIPFVEKKKDDNADMKYDLNKT